MSTEKHNMRNLISKVKNHTLEDKLKHPRARYIERSCLYCGETMYLRPHYQKLKYCNTYCMAQAKRYMPENSKELFLNHTKATENGCWEWQQRLDSSGYGVIHVKNMPVRAHRFSYQLFKGEITDNLFVCHRCDNPKCVNPDHLFLGTAKDNNLDRTLKGRGCPGDKHPRRIDPVGAKRASQKAVITRKERYGNIVGEKHHSAKITDAQAEEIRELRKRGLTLKAISERFPIKTSQIARLIKRENPKPESD